MCVVGEPLWWKWAALAEPEIGQPGSILSVLSSLTGTKPEPSASGSCLDAFYSVMVCILS